MLLRTPPTWVVANLLMKWVKTLEYNCRTKTLTGTGSKRGQVVVSNFGTTNLE